MPDDLVGPGVVAAAVARVQAVTDTIHADHLEAARATVARLETEGPEGYDRATQGED